MTFIVAGGVQRDKITGRFKRTRKPWSLKNFDDGYVDAKGRMRVYLPRHPRASSMGYVMRAIVAYEAYHKTSVPKTMVVHHRDENKLNDSKRNLQMLTHTKHQIEHRANPVICICKGCKKKFTVSQWRINQGRGKYCKLKCFYASGGRWSS